MVDSFYAAGLDHDGSGNGTRDHSPESDANYYGAFVRDP